MSLQSLTSTSTVTIERQAVTSGSAMGVTRSWGTANRPSGAPTTLSCSLQPVSGKELIQFLERGLLNPVKLYFSTDPQVTEQDRLVDSDGSTVYEIKSVSDAVNLGRLWKVVCERSSQDASA